MRQRLIVLAVLSAVLAAGSAVAILSGPQTSNAAPTRIDAVAFVPECPAPTYSANGNVSPLFCKIVNPLALKYYKRILPHLFVLGRAASSQQVSRALKLDSKHATLPQVCNAYALWSWRWHWPFGAKPVDDVAGFPNACG